MCVIFLMHVQMIIHLGLFFFKHRGCIFLCGNKQTQTSGKLWFDSLTSLNLTKWNKAGLMMGQNVNVESSLLGGAGLIYEFACVLQPNMALISRHLPGDVVTVQRRTLDFEGCLRVWLNPPNVIYLDKCENINTVMNEGVSKPNSGEIAHYLHIEVWARVWALMGNKFELALLSSDRLNRSYKAKQS